MPTDQQDLQPLQQLLTLLRPMPTPSAAPAANNTPIPSLMNSGAGQRGTLDRQVNPQNYPNSVSLDNANPLNTILQLLQAQAQPRPDIGAPKPVATFAGRVVNPGESPQAVLKRMPMGSGEGDLPTALRATAAALAPTAMQGASGMLAKALMPKLLASISPMTWKSMGPEAVAMFRNIQARFPDFFNKILASPTEFMAEVKQPQAGAYGTMQVNRPSASLAALAGDPSLAEKPTTASMVVSPTEAKKTVTPVHELQHGLNFPRVQQTDPADAATIGLLLNDLLTGSKGSLNQRIGEYTNVAGPSVAGPLRPIQGGPLPLTQQQTLINALSKLADPAVAQRPVNYYGSGENYLQHRSRAMMDEGLAYLAEHSLPDALSPHFKYMQVPFGKSGTEFSRAPIPIDLPALAKALGVGVNVK